MHTNDKELQKFLSDGRAVLMHLNSQFVELESAPNDLAFVDAAHRSLVLLRDCAERLELSPIAVLAGNTARIFMLLRTGVIKIDAQLIGLTLQVIDELQKLFAALDDGRDLPRPPAELLGRLLVHADLALRGISDFECSGLLDATASASSALSDVLEPRSGSVTDALMSQVIEEMLTVSTRLDRERSADACERKAGDDHSGAQAATCTTERSPTMHQRDGAAAELASPQPAGRANLYQADTLTEQVSSHELEELLRSVSAASEVCARLTTAADGERQPTRNQDQLELGRVLTRLDSAAARVRLQLIKDYLPAWTKTVQAIATIQKKQVRLNVTGADCLSERDLARTLVPAIEEILGAAISYRSERLATRAAKRKPIAGQLAVAVRQIDDCLLLTVCDDGQVIDADLLRRGAVASGALDADAVAQLNASQCHALLGLASAFVGDCGAGLGAAKAAIARASATVSMQSHGGMSDVPRLFAARAVKR